MLPYTTYTITVGDNKDPKWNSVIIYDLTDELVKGFCVGLMLFGANDLKINGKVSVRRAHYDDELLSKEELLDKFPRSIVNLMQYYRKWRPSDTESNNKVKVVTSPYTGNLSIIYLQNAIKYGIELSYPIGNEFILGLTLASGVTGIYQDFIGGSMGTNLLFVYSPLVQINLPGLPKEVFDIIASYSSTSFYSVNKKYYKMSRAIILNEAELDPERERRLVATILLQYIKRKEVNGFETVILSLQDNVNNNEVEALALTYIARTNSQMLMDFLFISRLASRKLCEAHYNKAILEMGDYGGVICNSIYVQFLVDIGYNFHMDVYNNMLSYFFAKFDGKYIYQEIIDCAGILINSGVQTHNPDVGHGVGVFRKDIAMQYFNLLGPVVGNDQAFAISVAWSVMSTYNLELFLEISNMIPDDEYGQILTNLIDFSPVDDEYPYFDSEMASEYWIAMYSNPRLSPSNLHYSSTRIPKIAIDAIRVGLLANPNFTEYHELIRNQL